MKYLSGIHALNLPCSLLTDGDWHTSALAWKNYSYKESSKCVFGDYGIETQRSIPFLKINNINIANHIRAVLDLLEEGDFIKGYCSLEWYLHDYGKRVFSILVGLFGRERA